MTEGSESDIKEFLQRLDIKVLDLTTVIGKVEMQAALAAQRSGTQDALLAKVEKHLSEINGNCKAHATTLAEHDTALALLEQRTVCALDRDCHLKEGLAKVPEVLPKVAENTSVLTLNLRENWLKWLIGLIIFGTASAGGSALVNILSR